MIKEAIVKIVNKGDLTYSEAYAVMNEIMSGETSATQNAAFLSALSTKSTRAETTDEIAGCAAAMRAHATKVETGMDLFEIVGTGGDGAHSFNISTSSALVAAAGILSACAALPFMQGTKVSFFFDTIGYSIGIMLFPVLSAFIAFSIGGRTALVAGFTGGIMADLSSAGVLGAVVNGLAGGAVAYLTTLFARRFLKGHDAMFALLVYPVVGTLGVTLIAEFVTNLPMAFLDSHINAFISSAGVLPRAILGGLLGMMMSADMGGPLNKISYACGVLLLADSMPEPGAGNLVMASVMAGGMAPPVSAGLAALTVRPLFSLREKKLALTAVSKGLLFVTEGVMPYMLIAPRGARVACFMGSGLAGALSMAAGCGVCAQLCKFGAFSL